MLYIVRTNSMCVYSMQMHMYSFPGKQEGVKTASPTTRVWQTTNNVYLLKTKRKLVMENRMWLWVWPQTYAEWQKNIATKFCCPGFWVIYTPLAENLNSSVSCLFVCICLHSDPWRNNSFWVNQWNFSPLALLPTSWRLFCMRMGE